MDMEFIEMLVTIISGTFIGCILGYFATKRMEKEAKAIKERYENE